MGISVEDWYGVAFCGREVRLLRSGRNEYCQYEDLLMRMVKGGYDTEALIQLEKGLLFYLGGARGFQEPFQDTLANHE